MFTDGDDDDYNGGGGGNNDVDDINRADRSLRRIICL